jgi:maleylacetate reductase
MPFGRPSHVEWRRGLHQSLPTQRVIWGHGAATAHLPSELARLDATRVLLLTSRSLGGAAAEPIASAIGSAIVGADSDLRPHVPRETVERLLSRARAARVDALITLGGGSVIDTAKAVAAELRDAGERTPALIALPTTLSGAEFAHYFGVTESRRDPSGSVRRVKQSYAVESVTPPAVLLDSRLAATTPDWLWSGSGMKALDHAIEGMLGPGERPLSDPAAAAGIRSLVASLPAARSGAPAARLSCQVAAWQCYVAPADITLGLSHRIGHVLGGTFQIPHSLTSAITLPAVLRTVADLDPTVVRVVVEALDAGEPFSTAAPRDPGGGAADRIESLAESLGLPTRLRHVGIAQGQLPAIAEGVVASAGEQPAALGLGDESLLIGVLRDAY